MNCDVEEGIQPVYPVLCGYVLHDAYCTSGAVMIHVARQEDIKRELKLQMAQRFRDGQFGKPTPQGWDFIWWRSRDYQGR